MKIGVAVPVKRGSKRGNEITALRWKSILTELGHDVVVFTNLEPTPDLDCLVAIHAIQCHELFCRFRRDFPDRKLIVCLSGTDLHGVFEKSQDEGELSGVQDNASSDQNKVLALESLNAADAIILLEPVGLKKLPLELHGKCHVIFQSAEPFAGHSSCPSPAGDSFQVSVIGHLRIQKDPMLAAYASRLLPECSKISLVHAGAILDSNYESEVQAEQTNNPRYHWLAKLEHDEALRVLVESDLTVLTSRQEGAPSIVSEAIVNGVPLLATRIDATRGMLGENYPGFFEVGDAQGLAELMFRAEQDLGFRNELRSALALRSELFTRSAEKEAWNRLLLELSC